MIDRPAGIAIEIRADLAVVAEPAVIGLPCRIRGLQHDVGGAVVLAHDEGDLVGRALDRVAIGIQPLNARQVDARHGIGGNVPAVGDRPVPGIDQGPRGVVFGVGLHHAVGIDPAPDLPRAIAAVIAEPEDLELVVAAGIVADVDLEINLITGIDADVGGETLDLRGMVHIPITLGCTALRPCVFQGDGIVGHGLTSGELVTEQAGELPAEALVTIVRRTA